MRKQKLYAVIQRELRRGDRTFFETEKEAEKEARDLLEKNKEYPGYVPPKQLLLVKVVGIVERTSRRRPLRKGDTDPESRVGDWVIGSFR